MPTERGSTRCTAGATSVEARTRDGENPAAPCLQMGDTRVKMPVTSRAPRAVRESVRRRSETVSATAGVGAICRARNVVERLGGRFSVEGGIDLRGGTSELRRWALLAELLSRDPAFDGHERAPWVLEQAPMVRFSDERCARLAELGETISDPAELEAAVAALLGWPARTARVFLRELRGIWRGADPELDARAARAARHVCLPARAHGLIRLAGAAHLDFRDLEAALIRLALSHQATECPGGEECPLVACDAEHVVHF